MEELEIVSSDVKGCGAMGGDRDRGMLGRRERGTRREKSWREGVSSVGANQ